MAFEQEHRGDSGMTLALDQSIINDPYQEPIRWWGAASEQR